MASFHEALLKAFSNHPIRKIHAGESIFEQGSIAGSLFILIEGRVQIVKDGKTVASSSQSGDIFGDIAVLLKIPNPASVWAVTESSFHVVADPLPFLQENSIVTLHLSELLARRLVAATEYLVNIKHQFAGHGKLGLVDEVLDTLIHRHPRGRIPPPSATINLPENAD